MNSFIIKRYGYDFIAILFFAILLIIFFSDYIFSGYIFFHNDLPTVHYPLKSFIKEEYSKGNIPLWSPYTGAGSPILAYGELLPFYPFNIVPFYLFSISNAFTFNIIVHLFLCGLFIYLYTRIIGLKPYVSILSSISFGFSAFCILHIHILNLLIGAIWLPLILFFIELYIQKDRLIILFCASFVHIIQFFGGHPQAAVYSFIITVPYLIFRYAKTRQYNSKIKKIAKLLITLLLFLSPIPFFSAIQMIPTLELTDLSMRKGGVADALSAYNVPGDYINYIFPTWFFGRKEGLLGARISYTDFGWDFINYIGLIPFILALIAFFKVKNEYVDFFSIVFLGSSVLQLGFLTPLYLLLSYIPGIKYFLNPSRFSQDSTFALVILACFGFNYLITKESRYRDIKEFLKSRGVFFAIYLLLLIYPCITELAFTRCVIVHPPNSFFGLHTIPTLVIGFLFVVSIIFLKKNWIIVPIFILTIIDLFIFGYNYNPRIHPIQAESITDQIKYLKEDKEPFRIFSHFRKGSLADSTHKIFENILLVPDLNCYYDLSSTAARLSLRIKRLNQINDLIEKELNELFSIKNIKKYPVNTLKSIKRDKESDNRIIEPINTINAIQEDSVMQSVYKENQVIDLSNIKYILTPYFLSHPKFKLIFKEPVKVYQNLNCSKRAFFVNQGEEISMENQLLAIMRNAMTNLKKTVLLENENDKPIYNPTPPIYNCMITNYEPLKIELELDVDQPGYLVLSDTYYPGWKASIDNKEVKILKADYLYRALRIENQGKHLITFGYEPLSFRIGLYLSLISITITLMLLTISIFSRLFMNKILQSKIQ
jgi:hypothetical protein